MLQTILPHGARLVGPQNPIFITLAYMRDSIVLVLNVISYCRIAHADDHDRVIPIS